MLNTMAIHQVKEFQYGTNNNFSFEWMDDFNDYNSSIWNNEEGDQLGHFVLVCSIKYFIIYLWSF